MLALARSLQNLEADGVTFVGRADLRRTRSGAGAAARRRRGRAVRRGARGPPAARRGRPGRRRPVAPAQLRVAVLNGTERTGLAATVADSLGALGFGVGEVGTAEQVTQQTLIRFSPDQAAAASLLASTVPSATSVPDPGTTGVLQLVLGSSFDDVLRPPAARGDPAAAPSRPGPPAAA